MCLHQHDKCLHPALLHKLSEMSTLQLSQLLKGDVRKDSDFHLSRFGSQMVLSASLISWECEQGVGPGKRRIQSLKP